MVRLATSECLQIFSAPRQLVRDFRLPKRDCDDKNVENFLKLSRFCYDDSIPVVYIVPLDVEWWPVRSVVANKKLK